MATWKTVQKLAGRLPESEESTSYGTPAFKVNGKLLVRKPALKIAGKGFVHLGEGDEPLSIPSEEKDDLLATKSDAYFQTAHHVGSPWLLVRLAKISKQELRELLTDAWRIKAPPKIRRAHPEV